MIESPAPPPVRHRAPPVRQQLLALCLTALAGYVDAAGYLLLSKIYTANMSGNSVALGMRLAQRDLGEIARRAVPIVFFFLGLVVSSAVHEAAKRTGRLRHPFAVMFGTEFLLLAAFTAAAFPLHPVANGDPGALAFWLLAGLAGAAMGVQNSSLRRAGALTIHTTHVTGLLLQCADATVIAITTLIDPPSGRARREAFLNVGFLFGVWILYVVGAILATLLVAPLGPAILVPGLILLAIWIVSDLRKPIVG